MADAKSEVGGWGERAKRSPAPPSQIPDNVYCMYVFLHFHVLGNCPVVHPQPPESTPLKSYGSMPCNHQILMESGLYSVLCNKMIRYWVEVLL